MPPIHGQCSCGAVHFTVRGVDAAMGAYWKPSAVQVTKGAEHIGTFNRTPKSCRKWCQVCGTLLYTEQKGVGLTDLYASLMTRLAAYR